MGLGQGVGYQVLVQARLVDRRKRYYRTVRRRSQEHVYKQDLDHFVQDTKSDPQR
jgi:hypothetical protein